MFFFLIPNSNLLIFISILVPIPSWVDYNFLVITFEMRTMSLPTLVIVFTNFTIISNTLMKILLFLIAFWKIWFLSMTQVKLLSLTHKIFHFLNITVSIFNWSTYSFKLSLTLNTSKVLVLRFFYLEFSPSYVQYK